MKWLLLALVFLIALFSVVKCEQELTEEDKNDIEEEKRGWGNYRRRCSRYWQCRRGNVCNKWGYCARPNVRHPCDKCNSDRQCCRLTKGYRAYCRPLPGVGRKCRPNTSCKKCFHCPKHLVCVKSRGKYWGVCRSKPTIAPPTTDVGSGEGMLSLN